MRQDSSDNSSGESFRKSSQSRLLCFVITAIAKLATYHRELLPRAQVSLGKVYFSAFSIISKNLGWKDLQSCYCRDKIKFYVLSFSPLLDARGFVGKIKWIHYWHRWTKLHELVAWSRTSDSRVWTRAYNYLGLLSDPGVSLSILGPSRQAALNPGTDWSQGGTKMVAHIPVLHSLWTWRSSISSLLSCSFYS